MNVKELTQRALWSITGSPGARYVRELRADVLALSRAEQCRAFGVSVWADDGELQAARDAWLERLPFHAALMDEVGARTPAEALAKWKIIKTKADEADRLQAEINQTREEMRSNATSGAGK